MSCHVQVRGMWNIGHKDMEHGMGNGEWGMGNGEVKFGSLGLGIRYRVWRDEERRSLSVGFRNRTSRIWLPSIQHSILDTEH